MSKLEVDAIEPQSGTTLTLGASGDSVNIASGATITDFTSTGIDDNATSTAITIDSSENVGIGTASPVSKLTVDAGNVNGGGAKITSSNQNTYFIIDNTGTSGAEWTLASTSSGSGFGTGSLAFASEGSERMRIDSAGSVLIGGTDTDPAVNGTESIALRQYGRISCNVGGSDAVRVGRTDTDGELVGFYQAGTKEGTISVSGSTVSYNGFTGTHWSRFTDNSKPTILRGTVLESLDEMCDWYNLEFDITTTTQDEDGNDVTNTITKKIPHVLKDTQSNGDTITYNHEGTDVQATIVKENDVKHMMSKVSDTTDAKNVYGVFVAYDEDGEGYNDFYVASVGSFVVRIKANETIAKGDLLQSNGDGTAKVQSDDNVKSSSFAKVLSTTVIETYEDGSYLVPCSLMC